MKKRRSDAWLLLWQTTVNVIYWKNVIERQERRRLYLDIAAPALSMSLALIAWALGTDWVKAVLTAVTGFVVTVINEVAKRWVPDKGIKAHLRWSQLRTDADALWRHGEHYGWDEGSAVTRTAELVERERQYDSDEVHNPNFELLGYSEEIVKGQMSKTYGYGDS